MKTTSILIILIFLTTQINAQNTILNIKDNANSSVIELPLASKIINSQPEFQGGHKELAKYLSKNLKYPRNSNNSSIRGKVIVSFKVEVDGEISDVNIVEGVNKILNKEAKRVVENMPNWKPAFENGISVSNVLMISIVFFRN
ncbi:energy transducer TonB [Lutibacter sp.]|uniref:energy transducer TonB n=1 Tax=Lutibacter sp. TaxID=1925666 RepID=UPI0027328474|nr:TonB family protein [Lutibacter sp.]MDP3311901.1 TonB family protein [Lutibacter sp.]